MVSVRLAIIIRFNFRFQFSVMQRFILRIMLKKKLRFSVRHRFRV